MRSWPFHFNPRMNEHENFPPTPTLYRYYGLLKHISCFVSLAIAIQMLAIFSTMKKATNFFLNLIYKLNSFEISSDLSENGMEGIYVKNDIKLHYH